MGSNLWFLDIFRVDIRYEIRHNTASKALGVSHGLMNGWASTKLRRVNTDQIRGDLKDLVFQERT